VLVLTNRLNTRGNNMDRDNEVNNERRNKITLVVDKLDSLNLCKKENNKYKYKIRNVSNLVLKLIDLDLDIFRELNFYINNKFHMTILNEYIKNDFITNGNFKINLYKKLLRFKKSDIKVGKK